MLLRPATWSHALHIIVSPTHEIKRCDLCAFYTTRSGTHWHAADSLRAVRKLYNQEARMPIYGRIFGQMCERLVNMKSLPGMLRRMLERKRKPMCMAQDHFCIKSGMDSGRWATLRAKAVQVNKKERGHVFHLLVFWQGNPEALKCMKFIEPHILS